MSIDLLLWIFAAGCFLLAALGVTAGRVSLGWLGLFFAALTFIV
jgi:hypothetical protein